MSRRTLGLLAACALGWSGAAQAQTTLRVVNHSDLKIIDPIWTTAYIVRNHGYLIYDTLFALDGNLEVKPQMVDKWSTSDDKLTWTFTLRDGLEFHDGAPVTAEDVVPSLKRWAVRDPLGQMLWTKVDRVEWITIPDQQTQVNALLGGEIDLVEIVPPDLLPLLAKDKNIKTTVVNKAGRQYSMRFNVLFKPFDNVKVRQAILYGLSQKEVLEANVGNPEYYRECRSLFPCGSPLESTKGWDDKLAGNVAKAKEMLAASGYDGTPVVFLHQTDTAGHNNLATVAKAQLEKIGLKVDLQPMDWQTLVSRRAKKDAPDKGGWGAYFTSWGATDVLNPVSAAFVNASCDKATFGWPCDETIEKLRDAYASDPDPAKQKAIAEQVQLRVLEYPTHAPLGQFTTPTAIRSNVNGLLSTPSLALWNIEKK